MLIHSPKEIALFVSNYRKKHKLSQTEVGNRVGLKQQTISEFELNPEGTQLDTLFRILAALNLKINISDKDQPTTNSGWKEEW